MVFRQNLHQGNLGNYTIYSMTSQGRGLKEQKTRETRLTRQLNSSQIRTQQSRAHYCVYQHREMF